MDLRTWLLVSCVVLYTNAASLGDNSTGTRLFSNLEADIGAYPWLVQICKGIPGPDSTNDISKCCAGAMLSEDYVLTSGNCLAMVEVKQDMGKSIKATVLMNTQTDTELQSPFEDHPEPEKYPHAVFDYGDVTLGDKFNTWDGEMSDAGVPDNIAIIMIRGFSTIYGKYSFSSDFKWPKIASEPAPSCMVFNLAAWGKDGPGHGANYNNLMKEAYLPNIVTENCGDVDIFSPTKKICAGCPLLQPHYDYNMLYHVGVCTRDFGAPLFHVDDYGDTWLYGLVAHSACASYLAATPTIFTNLHYYRDWICKKINDRSELYDRACGARGDFMTMPVTFECGACVDCEDCDSCQLNEATVRPTPCMTEVYGIFGRNTATIGMYLLIFVVVLLGALLIGIIISD